ncbi:uncharacterized protein B0P05DRAFT_536942 [Gilbertella persicaria]|uniref:uncharacterized protein n=1 Tax=Gilbertella persicaria TaxID=101096 RepID=UPI00221E81D9|nr:uncharacterized protein B0P05DRAFT_536942 [Gilbertella persicaria]KAI8083335.1 hypothetical protein B0P05DRAFT_536942 [Gilbertella persicaria]
MPLKQASWTKSYFVLLVIVILYVLIEPSSSKRPHTTGEGTLLVTKRSSINFKRLSSLASSSTSRVIFAFGGRVYFRFE